MGATEWALMLVLSVLWGSSFFFYKVLVTQVPPFSVVLGRVGLAAILLNILVKARGGSMPRDFRLWVNFVFLGILNNVVPFTLSSARHWPMFSIFARSRRRARPTSSTSPSCYRSAQSVLASLSWARPSPAGRWLAWR